MNDKNAGKLQCREYNQRAGWERLKVKIGHGFEIEQPSRFGLINSGSTPMYVSHVDVELPGSALSRPKPQFNYKARISIFDLAAAYSFGVAGNHHLLMVINARHLSAERCF